MDTTLGRRVAAAVRSSANLSGGGNSNIIASSSSGSHNPGVGASGSVLIGGSTTATSGVGSGSLSSSSTATGPRLRRQRSYEWRERQYSTSEDENVVTTSGGPGLLHVVNTRTSNASLQSTGGGSSGKQRASPTPAVYAAGIASLLAGYSSAERSSLSGINSYRTGSDTEEATTTDNPTTPFPTPPPTCASPTMYHHPLSSSQHSPNLSSSGGGAGGHRQASPYPLESTNLSGNSTPVNSTSPRFPTHMPSSSSTSRHHHGGHHHHHYPTKKSSLSRSDASVGSKQSAGQSYGPAGSSGTLGSRGRVSANSRRMAAQQQQQQGGATMTSSSSTSSASSATDNNSDMTYPDVEMLGGVKDGRRLHLENDLADDSPPEPAPPEVPPRGPSLHHPLQGHATLRGRSGGSVNYSLSSGPGDADNMDDPDYGRGVGASAGNSCVFLSQEGAQNDVPLLLEKPGT
ncbi:secreted protein C-like [Periplaneta americana]|uniref:secreted protein C-like n=1 Tax=Periplaneta americana TaxID=6978 RepID=UPI0037E91E8B